MVVRFLDQRRYTRREILPTTRQELVRRVFADAQRTCDVLDGLPLAIEQHQRIAVRRRNLRESVGHDGVGFAVTRRRRRSSAARDVTIVDRCLGAGGACASAALRCARSRTATRVAVRSGAARRVAATQSRTCPARRPRRVCDCPCRCTTPQHRTLIALDDSTERRVIAGLARLDQLDVGRQRSIHVAL